jgi:tRNA-modifying protein YgfZ
VATTDTTTLASQYATLTERCGLVDRSERGKLALSGTGAVEFLNGQVTNELLELQPGAGCYAAFLTHKGKMLGDLRILSVGHTEESSATAGSQPSGKGSSIVDGDAMAETAMSPPAELLLDTERIALQALFDMIRRFKVGYDVELHKRTLESSLLSLIGPDSDRVASEAFTAHPLSGLGPSHLPEREDSHLVARSKQIPVRLIRTDVGVDALFDAEALDAVRGALQAVGAVEVSEAAAEIVRVQSGRPRYGVDLDESTIPQEAGLNERAVSFTKGCYVGQETVARLHYRGKPNRHLRGLRFSAPIEPGAELHLGERAVGHVTSAVLSPALGPIGLALVRREAEPGDTVAVSDGGASAVVSELPFH